MRILYSILMTLLIVFTPYWFYLPVMFLGIVIFPMFVEAIVFGVIVDFAYGTPMQGSFLGFTYGVTSALLVLLAVPLRRHLRLNA